MKIIHIITGLTTGGAEMMLFKILSRMDTDEFESEVISLTGEGPIAEKIRMLGVPVHILDMNRGGSYPVALIKLTLLLLKKKPDLVQTWLYHSDLIGGLAAKLAGGIKVFWNIRQGDISLDSNKRSALWLAKACAKISYWLPEKIICCSQAVLEFHSAMGYSEEKMIVLPNGFDLEEFKPDHNARKSVRDELGITEKIYLVGLMARFHPQKDHLNFINAAKLIKENIPSAHFMLCGDDINSKNTRLMHWIKQAGLETCVHLLGVRNDVPRLTAAMDVSVSSSLGGEGFPNVVGEAMACGVPCVVTDVGDSALIIGDAGRVAVIKDPEALALEIIDLLQAPAEFRKEMGRRARLRVEKYYSLDSAVKKYQTVYKGVAG